MDRRLTLLAVALCGLCQSACFGESAPTGSSAKQSAPVVTVEDYQRANQMLPWNMRRLINRLDFAAIWTRVGDSFMYRVEDEDGAKFYLVDPQTGEKRPAFDRDKLAAALSKATGRPIDPKNLPINIYYRNYHQPFPFPKVNAAWKPDLQGLTLKLEDGVFECDLTDYTCRRLPGALPPAELGKTRMSPNKLWAAFHRDHNLFVHNMESGQPRALTQDGTQHYAYAKTAPGIQDLSVQRYGLTHPPVLAWSPDSTKLVTHRFDEREVGFHHIVEAAPADGSRRPKHFAYKYPIPGEAVPLSELIIFDVKSGQRTPIKIDPISLFHVASIIELRGVFWSADSKQVYLVFPNRRWTQLNLMVVDAETGQARTLIEENSDERLALTTGYGVHHVKVLGGGAEIIWYSEQDGWPHLYLHDGRTGELKNRITEGEWLVRSIARIDEANRQIYFLAAGREPDRGPYRRHLYRASLDGGDVELLTPEDADHKVSFSPSGAYFTDTFSRVDTIPVTVLRRADGQRISVLEEADISQLTAAGWSPPEAFSVKAADGETDLYGIIVKPTHFNPAKKYPVIDAIYPAPGRRVPHNFHEFVDSTGQPQAITELGFITVLIDGRGTQNRDRAFRNFVFKNYHNAGLGDHVAGIKALAKSRPYMDIDRVGVYGHSNGGTNTQRAMLNHPDFYDVAVASAASSDRSFHSASWEATIGPYADDAESWELQNLARPELVAGFKGRMMIVMGELDGNVHPAQALRLMAEMIRQNKDFDFLLMPGRNHDFKPDSYFVRRRWDYFVEHLLGAEPPKGFKVDGEDEYVHPPLLFRPPS